MRIAKRNSQFTKLEFIQFEKVDKNQAFARFSTTWIATCFFTVGSKKLHVIFFLYTSTIREFQLLGKLKKSLEKLHWKSNKKKEPLRLIQRLRQILNIFLLLLPFITICRVDSIDSIQMWWTKSVPVQSNSSILYYPIVPPSHAWWQYDVVTS